MATRKPPKSPRKSTRKPARVRSFGAQEFRHKAFTLAEQVKALTQFMSLSAISRETGIPRTTLRRYRDGGHPGREVGELYSGIIGSGFQIMHREVVRERSQSRKVVAVGKGVRVMRRDPADPSKRIPSDSIDRNIMNSSDGAILRTMNHGAQRARFVGAPGFVRFLVLAAETDPQYPGEYFWTEPEALSDLSPEEIADVLAETQSRGTAILMRIQDRG